MSVCLASRQGYDTVPAFWRQGEHTVSNARRAWISALIAMIVLVLVTITMPPYNVDPKGIVLPLQGKQAPYFGQVNIYEKLTTPANAEKLGSISLLYHAPKDTYVEQQAIVAAARHLAARAGGNALLIKQMGHTYPDTPSAMAVMILRGAVLKAAKDGE